MTPPRYGYYSPDERLRSFLEIYSYRVGLGKDATVDDIGNAFYQHVCDPESRRLRDAFADAVEAAS